MFGKLRGLILGTYVSGVNSPDERYNAWCSGVVVCVLI